MNYLKSANVTNEFERDLRNIVYTDLNLSKNEQNEFEQIDFIQVLSIHREFMSRLIPAKKYVVNVSRELQEKIDKSNFNNPNDMEGIKTIIKKLKTGQDITPHLSRKVKDILYNDALYNDWRLYHLHLGTKIETDGYISRTKNVLFAFKEKNNIYLIDILPHGNGNIPWTNEQLLKIIDNNWPFLLIPYDISNTVIQTSINFNEQEHYKLRKSEINAIKSINNRILVPLNLGVTLAGTSVLARMMIINLFRHLTFMHNFVVNNYEQISEFVSAKNINLKVLSYNDNFDINFAIKDNPAKIILQINNKNMLTRIIFLRNDIQKMLTFDAIAQ